MPDGRKKKERISTKVRALVSFMVNDGKSRPEAAALAGISDHWAYQALRQPSVRGLRNEMLGSLRESEASRSISRVAKLADTADSEHVRLGASTFLLGIEGVSPITRVEGRIDHLNHTPGLTVIFEQPAAQIVDGTARELATPKFYSLHPPRPHPSDLKREMEDE